jgi:hypothetical protein
MSNSTHTTTRATNTSTCALTRTSTHASTRGQTTTSTHIHLRVYYENNKHIRNIIGTCIQKMENQTNMLNKTKYEHNMT